MTLVHRFRSSGLLFAALALPAFAACGGEDVVEAPANPGFVAPTAVTMANMGDEPLDPEEPADWSCLNTASDDEPTAVAITLTGVLNDFQNDTTELRDATVTVFEGGDHGNPIDEFGPTLVDGMFSLDLPTGVTRFGFKVTQEDYMDTFLLNQYFDPDMAAQSQNISAISSGLATALPAIIGLVRTPGTGVLAGAIRDCQDHEVSNAIATVSATAGEFDHLEGAATYYLDAGAGLPVRHDQLIHTDANGLFAVFELPVTTAAFIQVWGYIDEADVAEGEAGLTLLAELPSPVVTDTVITGSIEPLRN